MPDQGFESEKAVRRSRSPENIAMPLPNRFADVLTAAAAVACLAATAGCGLGTAAGYTPSGELAGPVKDVNLGGASLSVGSKNFTEQLILGKIAVILMKSAGADVTDLTNIPGSASARST